VRLLAIVVGAVLIILTPLAHASPIDPNTPGFWDASDFNDGIIFLTSHLHFVNTDARPAISTSQAVIEDGVKHEARTAQPGSYRPGSPRAPPAS